MTFSFLLSSSVFTFQLLNNALSSKFATFLVLIFKEVVVSSKLAVTL